MNLKQGLAKLLTDLKLYRLLATIESGHGDDNMCKVVASACFPSDFNYRRIGSNDIFTSQQVINLIMLAEDIQQIIVLLEDTALTDEPATDPNSRYGPAGK